MEISSALTIIVVVLVFIIAILAIVYLKMTMEENGLKKKSKENDGETSASTKIAREYTLKSIFDFMEFDKIEDDMIIQKGR